MKEGPSIAVLADLIGEPARGNILEALMRGQSLTAGELAREAGVTAQTASGHLAKLLDGGLVTAVSQGRHRYYRLAGPEVATTLEALMSLAARTRPMRARPGPRDAALREARICYDHLAGAAGVSLYDSLLRGGRLEAGEGGLAAGSNGRRFFADAGIDLQPLEARRRPLCRACLDWSERRPHLAGALGAALLALMIERRWLRRDGGSRVLVFSPPGRMAFDRFCQAAAGTSARPDSDRPRLSRGRGS